MRQLSTKVPFLRTSLQWLAAISALGDAVVAAVLLEYQLRMTYGAYNKPVPALLAASGLTFFVSLWMLLPSASSSKPSWRSPPLWAELLVLLTCSIFIFAGVMRLHSAAPDLISNCGPYFTCRALQAVLSLSWISWLWVTLQVALIAGAGLYHARRQCDKSIFARPFGSFDWEIYQSRTRRNTVRHKSTLSMACAGDEPKFVIE